VCFYSWSWYWGLVYVCMGDMQIQRSSMKGDRPECRTDPRHKVHKHGHYNRNGGPEDDDDKEKVSRFLCVPCNSTISVLPENKLPYRSINAERLVAWMNWELNAGPEPPVRGEKERGCMRRAFQCFIRHSPALTGALGQIVRDVCANAQSLWRTLTRQGNVSSILRFLQDKLKPEKTGDGAWRGYSLLGHYRCLAVQPFSSG